MDQSTQQPSRIPPPLPQQVEPALPPKNTSGVFIGILLLFLGILIGLVIDNTALLSHLRIPYLNPSPTPIPILTTTPTPTATLTPTPTLNPTANWKTYTNTTYGFSFSYPQDVTVSVGPDFCGGCMGSILNNTDKHTVMMQFITMTTGQGAYCNGSTINISLTPPPTSPMKVAEAEANCGCAASGVTGYQSCSKASGEKTISTSGTALTGYQFYLDLDQYFNNSKLNKSSTIGPFRAYFFPKPITYRNTENIGVYFKLEEQNSLNIFEQILSTFHFTE